MKKRKIITIDEDLCNGCGECIVGCHEGALQLIDGKAKLVKEDFCDGFGDCIGTCPTGALKIEERSAKEFDLDATTEHVRSLRGEEAVEEMLDSQKKHENKEEKPAFSGCPGMQARTLKKENNAKKLKAESGDIYKVEVASSEIEQWPLQLHLVNPSAPYFKEKELVIMNTCGSITSPDVHWKYFRGRSVVVACPKLDNTGPYAQKLSEIFNEMENPKIITVRMEVPCCGGLTMLVRQAMAMSGRNDLVVEEHIMGLQGQIKEVKTITV